MHLRSFTPILLAAVAVVLWTPPAARGSDRSEVQRLVDLYVEALGGRDRLAAVDSVQLSGTYTFNGEVFDFTLSRQRPDRFHLWIEQGEVDTIEVCNGDLCWRISQRSEGNASVLDSAAATRFLEEWSDFDGPLVDFEGKGHRVDLLGTEIIDGTEAHHLLLHLRSGNEQHWFLDAETHLPIRKITPQVHPRRGPYERSWYFESYREVEGLRFPEYFEREDRQFVRAYEITDVLLNVDLPPRLFSPPQP